MAKKEVLPQMKEGKVPTKYSYLSHKEYQEYRRAQLVQERFKSLARLKKRQQIEKTLFAQQRYKHSRYGHGKVSGAIVKGFQFLQSPTQALYKRSITPTYATNEEGVSFPSRTVKQGYNFRPGRPKGTYDQRYAAYGGVYGFRKAMALERFKQRQEILRNAAVTPRQQMILAQINARDQYNAQNVESQIIPDTKGGVHLKGIFDEVDVASNLVA